MRFAKEVRKNERARSLGFTHAQAQQEGIPCTRKECVALFRSFWRSPLSSPATTPSTSRYSLWPTTCPSRETGWSQRRGSLRRPSSRSKKRVPQSRTASITPRQPNRYRSTNPRRPNANRLTPRRHLRARRGSRTRPCSTRRRAGLFGRSSWARSRREPIYRAAT